MGRRGDGAGAGGEGDDGQDPPGVDEGHPSREEGKSRCARTNPRPQLPQNMTSRVGVGRFLSRKRKPGAICSLN